MISNLVLQNTIDGIKKITNKDFVVYSVDGRVLAATCEHNAVTSQEIVEFAGKTDSSEEIASGYLFKVYDELQVGYVILTLDTSANGMISGRLCAFQIQTLLVAYRERYDKDSFIKNLLLDNLLLVDIYNRAKKLHISTEARRVVFILETSEAKDYSTLESVKSIFAGKAGDFITAVDEKSIIVIKELEENDGPKELEQIANSILNALDRAPDDDMHVAYGTIIEELREVSRSYKEARMALDVGKIFFGDQDVIAYSSLGIGRLIYQLPIPLCKMFIKEIFGNKSPDDFDEETIVTINKFFENSLNVSETSRQLYIHRNTLVYRLDKLQKTTNLDLRVFEDAITFKIALMVVKYMTYMENAE
jgi:carbohydrate diacid regulator